MKQFVWNEELGNFLLGLFRNGIARNPQEVLQEIQAGNEEKCQWILMISCFLKSRDDDQAKVQFLKRYIGSDLEQVGKSPLRWIADLKQLLLVSLKS